MTALSADRELGTRSCGKSREGKKFESDEFMRGSRETRGCARPVGP